MDDISREPLPGGQRPGRPGMRGPAELVRLDSLSVDETSQTDGPDPDDPTPEAESSGEVSPSEHGSSEDLAPEEVLEERSRVEFADDAAADGALDGDAEASAEEPESADLEADEVSLDEMAEEAAAAATPLAEAPPSDVDDEDQDPSQVPELTDPAELARVLLGLLLVTREPLTLQRLAEVCNSSTKFVNGGLDALEQTLKDDGLPLEIVRTADKVRVMTAAAMHPYVRRLKRQKRVERLSPAALETLAVVAYKQPVIRAEIEAIRGVKVGPMLKSLLDHKLCKVVGRADVPGRPLQYGTTELFLERFGLGSLKELPSLDEFRALG